MYKCIYIFNDIYDILYTLHLFMINSSTPIFAYWIFTYGIIRILDNGLLLSLSYFIEAAFINDHHHYVNNNKTIFVIICNC